MNVSSLSAFRPAFGAVSRQQMAGGQLFYGPKAEILYADGDEAQKLQKFLAEKDTYPVGDPDRDATVAQYNATFKRYWKQTEAENA